MKAALLAAFALALSIAAPVPAGLEAAKAEPNLEKRSRK